MSKREIKVTPRDLDNAATAQRLAREYIKWFEQIDATKPERVHEQVNDVIYSAIKQLLKRVRENLDRDHNLCVVDDGAMAVMLLASRLVSPKPEPDDSPQQPHKPHLYLVQP